MSHSELAIMFHVAWPLLVLRAISIAVAVMLEPPLVLLVEISGPRASLNRSTSLGTNTRIWPQLADLDGCLDNVMFHPWAVAIEVAIGRPFGNRGVA